MIDEDKPQQGYSNNKKPLTKTHYYHKDFCYDD